MIFQNATKISSGQVQDTLLFDLKDPKYFEGRDTGKVPQFENLKPKSLPLLISDKEVAENIEATADIGCKSAAAVGIISFFISFLL